MTGRLIAVVGPSGAGKDTLMAAAKAAHPSLIWARRAITRPESAGGEPFEGVSREAFERRRAGGGFAVWWEAHGLLYGVPASIVDDLDAGRTVMFNGSRGAIGQARIQFPRLEIAMIRAPSAVLARRLAARGRETEDDIVKRLERASAYPAPEGAKIIDNDSDIETGAARFLAAFNLSAQSV
ncbi:MAG: phosphonate metabolism protein/1,5-bisphosphokinase (PRPP-forming) PhnN [Pseudomonadota bacterium]